MYKSRLSVERAIAGTAKVEYPDLNRAPQIYDERNLYFDSDVPSFDFALKAWGQSAVASGIEDGDIVLCQNFSAERFVPKEGYIVIVPASKCYTQHSVHEDWKCIRTITKVHDVGTVEVRAGFGDNEKLEDIPVGSIIGHAVYSFEPHAV